MKMRKYSVFHSFNLAGRLKHSSTSDVCKNHDYKPLRSVASSVPETGKRNMCGQLSAHKTSAFLWKKKMVSLKYEINQQQQQQW